MTQHNSSDLFDEAVEQLNRCEDRDDGSRVVGCLSGGLTLLRQSIYERVHADVQRLVGADSMLIPLSEAKTRLRAIQEIETFQIAESGVAARQYNYIHGSDTWYVEWLAALRLGSGESGPTIQKRCLDYLNEDDHDRHLLFGDWLGRVLPESRQAPLVLFRLIPMAIRIATACAFSDRTTASGLRRRQATILPVITDCRECRGEILECGEQCSACGNPLWKFEWLTEID